jgi:endonuclease/exonuclease/phosphatase family metal-dependent hydrolase
VVPVTLSLATFNVQNFFDEKDDLARMDDLPTPTQVQSKITRLGTALRILEADVVALQEVENLALLERLNTEQLSELGYNEVRLTEGNDPRGIDVALLSRFEVIEEESHRHDTFPGVDGDTTTYGFSRDCPVITLQPGPGLRVFLLINHLRSSYGDNDAEALARRQAQAQRVREIADELLQQHPGAHLVVMGDLNDRPSSRTLELIIQGSPPLLDLLTLVPAEERYTTSWSNRPQFDYLLVSPALEEDLISDSVRADHASAFSNASDHYPVIASFTVD